MSTLPLPEPEPIALGRTQHVLIAVETLAAQVSAHAQREPDPHVAVAITAAAAQLRAVRARLAADVALITREPLSGALSPDLTPLIIGELRIDRSSRTVTLAGAPIEVANREYGLLCALAVEPTRVWSKNELYKAAWGDRWLEISTRTLDSHICRLRRKLGGAPWCPNTWGVGYSLVPPSAALQAA